MAKKKPSKIALWEVTADMFLSEPEADSLLKHVCECVDCESAENLARVSTDRLIIELLLLSGLRNSELCHLRVIDTVIGHGQSGLQVKGTPKQDRMVYVPQSLSDEITRFVKTIRPECVSEGISPNDKNQPLILNERGRPYDRTALYRRVVRILTEAGFEERASVQLLRHTYGFLAYKRTGGNLLFVQRQLGHAHPMVTAVYAQFVQFSDVELADRVAGERGADITRSSKSHSKVSRLKGNKR